MDNCQGVKGNSAVNVVQLLSRLTSFCKNVTDYIFKKLQLVDAPLPSWDPNKWQTSRSVSLKWERRYNNLKFFFGKYVTAKEL